MTDIKQETDQTTEKPATKKAREPKASTAKKGSYTPKKDEPEFVEAIEKKITNVKTEPNDGLGLEEFDYFKFKSDKEAFAKYQKIVQKLNPYAMYDWILYKAEGIFEVYTNPVTRVKEATNNLIGIEIIETKPISVTRVEARHIEMWSIPVSQDDEPNMIDGLNTQVYYKDNLRGCKKFYLLKPVGYKIPE